MLVPTVVLITVNERLYGGLTPYAAVPGDPTGADSLGDYLERFPRLVTAAHRSRTSGSSSGRRSARSRSSRSSCWPASLRERLAVALPDVVDVEVTAGFLAALCAAQVARRGVPRARVIEETRSSPAASCCPRCRSAPRCAPGRCATRRAIGAALAALDARRERVAAGRRRARRRELAPPDGPLPWGGAEVVVARPSPRRVVFLLARELWREREL